MVPSTQKTTGGFGSRRQISARQTNASAAGAINNREIAAFRNAPVCHLKGSRKSCDAHQRLEDLLRSTCVNLSIKMWLQCSYYDSQGSSNWDRHPGSDGRSGWKDTSARAALTNGLHGAAPLDRHSHPMRRLRMLMLAY
jgi:hypothetical protein